MAKTSTSSSFISPEELSTLLEVMARHGATELTHVRGSGADRVRLTLRRGGEVTTHAVLSPAMATTIGHAAPSAPVPSHYPAPAPSPAAAASNASGASASNEEGVVFVTSPLVGTFYRSPGPESPPFVEIGTRFKAGQRLCIVEAMKLMNEIEAELEGTILEILVENGKPVEYGQKLFRVKKG
jgi:acetyl-CoA carboxylase biotin carboxyl carrier protein